VPVVGLDSGPLVDLEATVRVMAGDAPALAEAAVRLAKEPGFRESVVQAGRSSVATRFDARIVADGYERVYDEVLRGRPRRP
jgi:glycosyltransferase involved in cell wall biosynthesis